MNPKPIPIQPVLPVKPTPTETALKQVLRQDARTHIGRMFK